MAEPNLYVVVAVLTNLHGDRCRMRYGVRAYTAEDAGAQTTLFMERFGGGNLELLAPMTITREREYMDYALRNGPHDVPVGLKTPARTTHASGDDEK